MGLELNTNFPTTPPALESTSGAAAAAVTTAAALKLVLNGEAVGD